MLLVANWESNVGYAWWLMESFWIEIAKHLASRNMQSLLIYPEITKIPETITNSGITVAKHRFQDKTLTGLRNLHKLIKRYNIKHIYLTDSPTYSLMYLILRLWGINTITIHEHTPGERTPPGKLLKFIKKAIHRTPLITANRYIAVSEYIFDRFINISCIPFHKCRCASNGIIPFELKGLNQYYAHQLFGIPKEKVIVVTTGRATYYKKIDFFIKCANELVNIRSMNNFHFVYCGDGPNLEDFKNMVYIFKLNKNFTFAGRRNDIRQILPSCHIGLHTSAGEVGYSLSILEYMSANLLTIVPDNPSVSLATTNNVTGLLYKENDILDCADKISLFNASNEISTIRKNGQDSISSQFNLKNTHVQLVKHFDETYINS
ncbi:hypothetical protein MNBD_GAMMA12-2376 [hydrothermal vent metagenome]|uniref:Glycosyl transferase family 1 domain-containing protein n=1 Tax=hydrothermal vent metagenome TaxID=652676 RepID=A0A3B0YY63_9ZZZZ